MGVRLMRPRFVTMVRKPSALSAGMHSMRMTFSSFCRGSRFTMLVPLLVRLPS